MLIFALCFEFVARQLDHEIGRCQGASDYLSADFKSWEGWKNDTFWLNIGIMLLTFSKFFQQYYNPLLIEMKQSDIDDIEDAIEDIEERPFNELFGNRDRFIVKNKLGEALDALNLDPAKFDFKNGFYFDKDGKHRFGSILKYKTTEYMRDYDVDETDDVLSEYISIIKQSLNEGELNPYLLYSRYPLDVLRMSDINNIKSCHSQGESEYHCAQQEARNLGGIVYLLNGEDYDAVKNKLNDREIFEDPERGIPGIKAQARVRLRRFIDKNTGEDFAVPEERFYEPRGHVAGYSGGMTKDVLEYAKEHQAISKKNIDPAYFRENIYHVGGAYEDTPYTSLVNKFFSKPEMFPRGSYSHFKSRTDLSKVFGDRPSKRFLKEIEELSRSSDIEDDVYSISVEHLIELLQTLSVLKGPKYNVSYPKVEKAILDIMERFSGTMSKTSLNELRQLVIDISNHPNLQKSLLNRILDFAEDNYWYSHVEKDEKTADKIIQFLSANIEGVKKLLMEYDPVNWPTYERYMSSLFQMIKGTSLENELTPIIQGKYIKNIISWGRFNLENFAKFEEIFEKNIYDIINENDLWSTFLRTANESNNIDIPNQLRRGGILYPILNYPKAVQELLTMVNETDDNSSDPSFIDQDRVKILQNHDFSNSVSKNYQYHQELYEQAMNNLIEEDLKTIRLYHTRYFARHLNLWNFINSNTFPKGIPELAASIFTKYKDAYNNALVKEMTDESKYGNIDRETLNILLNNLGVMRDDYGWYSLEYNGGAFKLADELLSNTPYDDDDQY